MFMFGNKRNALVKRIWRFQILQQQQQQQQQRQRQQQQRQQEQRHCQGSQNEDEARRLKSLLHSMLKRLKEPQLEVLLRALESEGSETTAPGSCVLVPKGPVVVSSSSSRTTSPSSSSSSSSRRISRVSPHNLTCKIFRWKDLPLEEEEEGMAAAAAADLKQLQICQNNSSSSSSESDSYICCNPYHWSKRLNPEIPLLPLSSSSSARPSRIVVEPRRRRRRNGGRIINLQQPPHHQESSALSIYLSSSSIVSYSTNGTQNLYGSDAEGRRPLWCKLAYWEEKTRVGPAFPVSETSVDVFSKLSKGSGLSLSALFSLNETPSKSTLDTRKKIGQGLLLSAESDGVWVYNRTLSPVFVNSPTLDECPNSGIFTTHELPPGHSLLVFDYERSRRLKEEEERSRRSSSSRRRIRWTTNSEGPVDPNSVRISFAKGWGKGPGGKKTYTRQIVTCCPCWIEILLIIREEEEET